MSRMKSPSVKMRQGRTTYTEWKINAPRGRKSCRALPMSRRLMTPHDVRNAG